LKEAVPLKAGLDVPALPVPPPPGIGPGGFGAMGGAAPPGPAAATGPSPPPPPGRPRAPAAPAGAKPANPPTPRAGEAPEAEPTALMRETTADRPDVEAYLTRADQRVRRQSAHPADKGGEMKKSDGSKGEYDAATLTYEAGYRARYAQTEELRK